MKPKRWYGIVTVPVVLLCLAGRSPAGTWTYDDWIVRFDIPEQSIWKQELFLCPEDNKPFSLHAGPKKVEDPTSMLFGTGVDVWFDGSLGAVSGNIEGLIAVGHDRYVPTPGPVAVSISYTPLADESRIHATLGFQARAEAILNVDFPWPTPDIVNLKGSLGSEWVGFDVTEDFTSDLGTPHVGSGASHDLWAFSVGAGVAGAGVAGNVFQEVSFTPLSITGSVKYTHLETGQWLDTLFSVPFVFDRDPAKIPLELTLDRAGWWEVEVTNLDLENTFSQKLGASITGSAWFTLLGKSAEASLPLGLWDQPPFELVTFGVSPLGRFNVFVDSAPIDSGPASPAVPVPGAGSLLGAGLLVLATGRRRYRHWVDRG